MGEGLPPLAVSSPRHHRQSFEELFGPDSDSGLSRDDARDFSFEGFPDPQTGSEVLSPSSGLHPVSVWRSLLGMMSSMSAIVPGSRLRMRSLQLRLNAAGPLLVNRDLISWDDGCLRDLQWQGCGVGSYKVRLRLLVFLGCRLRLLGILVTPTPTPRILVTPTPTPGLEGEKIDVLTK